MYTFKKEERLCSKKVLTDLFSSGSSFLIYPFRVVHMRQSLPPHVPAQVVISAPKRRFKHAVDRNLIKRRIREVYRLNKAEHLYSFLKLHELQIAVSIHYVGKELTDFSYMEKKLLTVLKQLRKAYGEVD